MEKKDKYNVGKEQKDIEKRTFGNVIFASEMEMKYYRDVLLPEQKNGIIEKIIIQPRYLLQPKFHKYEKSHQPINYVSDFEVSYSDGRIITIDIKGQATEAAKIKRKIWDFVYPKRILLWITLSQKYGGWIEYDELIKIRAKNKRNKHANESL